jgi:dolichol-phosphate mannosyltransferase/undecaprenyl-phosphate 4-deoxy-4-formamido-L-arabinose transferase
MVRSFSNLLINNSAGLLQLIAVMGISISIISSLMALFFFLKKVIVGINVTGWTSLMIAVTVLGGLILFSIGVVGEYLIRIINGVERKPPFIIRKKRNGN